MAVQGLGVLPLIQPLNHYCSCTVTLFFMTSSGNEWKTRYETQVELNGQLERQMSLMHERLEGLRGNPVGEFISDGAPSVCLWATDTYTYIL